MHSNGKTIMELPDSTTGVLLVLAYSVKIQPRGQRTVPLEYTKKLTDQMDIRIDAGFHHINYNVHITPSCVDNQLSQLSFSHEFGEIILTRAVPQEDLLPTLHAQISLN